MKSHLYSLVHIPKREKALFIQIASNQLMHRNPEAKFVHYANTGAATYILLNALDIGWHCTYREVLSRVKRAPGTHNGLIQPCLLILYIITSCIPWSFLQASCTLTQQTSAGTHRCPAGSTGGRSNQRKPTWPYCLTSTSPLAWTPSDQGNAATQQLCVTTK